MRQTLSTQRSRIPARRLVIVLAVALCAAIFALPVAAASPAKSEDTIEYDSVLTGVCAFDVNVHSINTFTWTDFVDKNGVLTKSLSHQIEQDTFTANAKTLVGIPFTFNLEIFFDNNGDVTHWFANGLVEKVPLPDGSLFVSAGRLDWMDVPADVTFVLSPEKGNPGNLAGFCAALAP